MFSRLGGGNFIFFSMFYVEDNIVVVHFFLDILMDILMVRGCGLSREQDQHGINHVEPKGAGKLNVWKFMTIHNFTQQEIYG